MSIEPGTYHGKLEAMGTDKLSNDNATPYLWFRFGLTHKATPSGEWEELPGVFIAEPKLFLSPKALPFTLDKLDPMNFNGDFGDPAVDPRYTTEGTVVIGAPGNDPKYTNFDLQEWATSSSHSKLDAASSAHLNSLWKARPRAVTSPLPTKGPPPAAPPPPPQAAETDEQLPF